MGQLLYSVIASLDGYVDDTDGGFAWAMPDEDVHAYVNDQMRSVGTHLYGRRLYEVMAGWQTLGTSPEELAVMRDFGELWRGADKVVYSTTLGEVSTPRTTLERRFDPDAVRALVTHAEGDVHVGGPRLAEHALRAGLVDEIGVVLAPVVVGGGTPYLPTGLRLRLRLLHERRFANGFAALRYAVMPAPSRTGHEPDGSMSG